VDDDAKPSAGHAADVPVQLSATSHTPAAERHTVVDGANVSAGHAMLTPSHASATSHTSVALRQTVPEVATVHATVQQSLPAIAGSQASPGSRIPSPQTAHAGPAATTAKAIAQKAAIGRTRALPRCAAMRMVRTTRRARAVNKKTPRAPRRRDPEGTRLQPCRCSRPKVVRILSMT
jgi:hypothetical protein